MALCYSFPFFFLRGHTYSLSLIHSRTQGYVYAYINLLGNCLSQGFIVLRDNLCVTVTDAPLLILLLFLTRPACLRPLYSVTSWEEKRVRKQAKKKKKSKS